MLRLLDGFVVHSYSASKESTWFLRWARKNQMEHDPNLRGHLPSRVPLMRLFGSPAQESLCLTILVFARPARKNQELTLRGRRAELPDPDAWLEWGILQTRAGCQAQER
jgi:hypothetical protein